MENRQKGGNEKVEAEKKSAWIGFRYRFNWTLRPTEYSLKSSAIM